MIMQRPLVVKTMNLLRFHVPCVLKYHYLPEKYISVPRATQYVICVWAKLTKNARRVVKIGRIHRIYPFETVWLRVCWTIILDQIKFQSTAVLTTKILGTLAYRPIPTLPQHHPAILQLHTVQLQIISFSFEIEKIKYSKNLEYISCILNYCYGTENYFSVSTATGYLICVWAKLTKKSHVD